MNTENSKTLFNRALRSIPGGVNSPVRAFKSVGGNPIFFKKAKGAYLYDQDGNEYVDFINSWGPMILGHGHPDVIRAIQETANNAISFGAPTEAEINMAELIKSMAPNVDLVRLVSSGTEACMSALRLARAHTKKNKVIKFEGCYHGHADSFLVKAGSGLATLGINNLSGIPQSTVNDTLIAPYNDLEFLKNCVNKNKNEIAAIIIEPVAGNMGCIIPNPDFILGIRKICDQENIVLIFDEVMTGFRLAPGGAQELLKINADLITFGKVIGGGLPVGAFAGRKEIMEKIAPLGDVYQAGTLSGNPLAVAAGFTTLSILKNTPSIYSQLENTTQLLKKEISDVLNKKGVSYIINSIGSMFSLHFGINSVNNFTDATNADIELFNAYFHHLLKNGIYIPPSAYETWFISCAISEKEIEKTIKATQSFLN